MGQNGIPEWAFTALDRALAKSSAHVALQSQTRSERLVRLRALASLGSRGETPSVGRPFHLPAFAVASWDAGYCDWVVSESASTGASAWHSRLVVWLFGPENSPKGATFGQITELRFVGADDTQMSLEVRATFPDWPYEAIRECIQLVRWDAPRGSGSP